MNKWVYYIILLVGFECMVGIQSSYSLVKQLIGEYFSISEQDFGIYEMINMVSRFFGVAIVIIAPIRRIKLTYLVFVALQIVAYLMICSTYFFPALFEYFFPIANIMIGLGTGILLFPYLLIYICFKDAEKQTNQQNQESGQIVFSSCIKTAFNIFLGLAVLGHAHALLLGRWMVDDLGLDWVVSLFTFTMIYLFMNVLAGLFVPEKKIQLDDEEVNLSAGKKICSILKTMKVYYSRNLSNVLLLLEYCFIDNISNMVVYWVPFFFMAVGFGFNATWVALSYPIGVALGSFIISPLLNRFIDYQFSTTTFILLLECVCAGLFWIIQLKEENLIVFVVLLGLTSMFWIGPYSRLNQSDLLKRIKSQKQKYLAVNSMRMATEILSAVYTFMIGYFMESNPRNFLFFLTVNPVVGLILHVIRFIREKREMITEQEKKEDVQSRKESEENIAGVEIEKLPQLPEFAKHESNQNLVMVI